MVAKIAVLILSLVVSSYGIDDLFCQDDNFFYCGKDGGDKCIPFEFVCDYVQDCSNNKDEINCQYRHYCSKGDLLCQNGQCIDAHLKCDNQQDCEDNSDEEFCHRLPRPPNVTNLQRAVAAGAALPNLLMDHFDEHAEAVADPCRADELFCGDDSSKKCVPKAWQCDNVADCPNRKDEDSCEYQFNCQPNEFICRSGECILADHKCDGIADCEDFSDEIFCHSPTPTKFTPPPNFTTTTAASRPRRPKTNKSSSSIGQKQPRSANTTVVSCNSVSEFLCKKANKCIPAEFRCNNKNDCTTGEDEADCGSDCERDGMSYCADRNGCYYHKCDGYIECKDGSDEKGCDLYPQLEIPSIEDLKQCESVKEFQSTLVAYVQSSVEFMKKMSGFAPCAPDNSRSVLIEGIPEPYMNALPSSKRAQDEKALIGILDQLNVDAVPAMFYRVGSYSPIRSRVIKAVFPIEEHALEVVGNAQKAHIPGVNIKLAN